MGGEEGAAATCRSRSATGRPLPKIDDELPLFSLASDGGSDASGESAAARAGAAGAGGRGAGLAAAVLAVAEVEALRLAALAGVVGIVDICRRQQLPFALLSSVACARCRHRRMHPTLLLLHATGGAAEARSRERTTRERKRNEKREQGN